MDDPAHAVAAATMIGILTATTLVYSFLYNSRRTEHITYGLWSAVVNSLISSYPDLLIPHPQFNLYTTSPDFDIPRNNDGNSSSLTIFEPDAVGVYVDLSVVLPRIILVPDSDGAINRRVKKTVATFLNDILSRLSAGREITFSSKYWFPYVRVAQAEVPLLIENKRLPTRHPQNIEDFSRALALLVNAAEEQAMSQAHCLFSSVKFGLQDSVILIAGVGEWWTCQIVQRNDKQINTKFDPSLHGILLQELQELPGETAQKDEGDEHPSPKDLFVTPAAAKSQWSRNLAREIEQQKKKALENTEKQRQERAARTIRRDRIKNTNPDSKESLEKLKIDAKYPFTEDELRTYYNLRNDLRFLPLLKNRTYFIQESLDEAKLITSWTGVMRLGSKTSNDYLKMIRRHLVGMAEDERKERMVHQVAIAKMAD